VEGGAAEKHDELRLREDLVVTRSIFLCIIFLWR
jgi:hypothetical protein